MTMIRTAITFGVLVLGVGCATSGSVAAGGGDVCDGLAWDDCGRTSACRHGRQFETSAAGDESIEQFVCVARYPDLVSQLATPGVETQQVGWLRATEREVAQP